jgi:hypothetical protein
MALRALVKKWHGDHYLRNADVTDRVPADFIENEGFQGLGGTAPSNGL